MALIGKFPPEGFVERFDAIDRRFEAIDRRFDALEADIDRRFDNLHGEMEHRFARQEDRIDAMGHQLLAAFRGELNTAITSQTRSIIFAMVGSVATMGAFSLALVGVS